MSANAKGWMLEIDGVRAAISTGLHYSQRELDELADDYLEAVEWATQPNTHEGLRRTVVLANVHKLRAFADVVLPNLQRREGVPQFEGVTQAYNSALEQMESLVCDDIAA